MKDADGLQAHLSMRYIVSSLAAVAFWSYSVNAQEPEPYEPVYRAWVEAGPLFPQSSELHSFPGAGGAVKLDLDSGFRVGLGASYALKPYFSVDWEAAVLGSSVDTASGLDEIDATITQVPFLISGVLQYQNQTGITPFLGAGIGIASTAITVDETRSGTTVLEGSDYDIVFAWQLVGGLRYEFKKGWGVGVQYKYLWTTDAEWELDNVTLATGDQELKLDGIRSHAILAFLTYRF